MKIFECVLGLFGDDEVPPAKRARTTKGLSNTQKLLYTVHEEDGNKIMTVPSDADTIDWEQVRCSKDDPTHVVAIYRGSGEPKINVEDIINLLPASVVEANFKGRHLEGQMTVGMQALENRRPALTVIIDDSNTSATEIINATK